MSNSRAEKINHILEVSLTILAAKGYENSTIADISKAANVSRGILHYYFNDKEDLVSQVLATASDKLVQSALVGPRGKSQEEIVDSILNGYIDSLEKYPNFYAFLFEMWCAARRSEKIKKELQRCRSKIIVAIKKVLEEGQKNSKSKFDTEHTETIAKAFLALSDGISFHILLNASENLGDNGFLSSMRNMMLGALERG